MEPFVKFIKLNLNLFKTNNLLLSVFEKSKFAPNGSVFLQIFPFLTLEPIFSGQIFRG